MLRAVSCFATMLAFTGFAAPGTTEAAVPKASSGFAVEFSNCIESIGVGLLPTEKVRALVPAEFILVGDGQPVTPFVVRTAYCAGIAVAGHKPKTGAIVQIGAVIVPPDFSGDINNYMLWYFTSEAKLAQHLKALGVSAQHVPTLEYQFEPSDDGSPSPLHVAVRQPGRPVLSLDGTVVESEVLAGSFEAIWWVKVNGGSVRMDTTVPEIFIGTANLILTTDASNPLGQLIGGGSAGFPVLQQFNTFPNAHMAVSVGSP